ncbi:hypothetical protein [Hippea jasoniae]|uniref:hypothetical protein n=1 Tax=Hippea jasoniae TaxID=944479 RepID=UPI00054FABDB|nr:hypothetical protein [Hippea jasoniae]
MGITDWIIKLQNSKFARRFQYEPYIIRSVEFVDPKGSEKILVVYREVDYFKSLAVRLMKNEDNYYGVDIEQSGEIEENGFDKVVFFVSVYYATPQKIKQLALKAKNGGKIYCICFLKGSLFFETTLKITDKSAFNLLGREIELFEGFKKTEEVDFKKEHIKIAVFEV